MAAAEEEGLHRRLQSNLVTLRGSVGLTLGRLSGARALLSLPQLDAVPEDQRAQLILSTIIGWLRSYHQTERRLALAYAFAIDPVTFELFEEDERGSLDDRRHLVAQTQGVSDRKAVQWARDREDAALTDLVQFLVEQAIDHLATGLADRDKAHRTGLRDLTLDFYRGVDWDGLLAQASELDIFFTYGRSWRRSLTGPLAEFFDRPGTAARVVMPDLRSPRTTALPEIAKRAGQDLDRLRSNIADAYGYFADRGAEIWASDAAELYALYRFNSTMVVTMYNHQRGQSEGVPTLVAERGTKIFGWFETDFELLIANPDHSRKISPFEAKLWARYNGIINAEQEME